MSSTCTAKGRVATAQAGDEQHHYLHCRQTVEYNSPGCAFPWQGCAAGIHPPPPPQHCRVVLSRWPRRLARTSAGAPAGPVGEGRIDSSVQRLLPPNCSSTLNIVCAVRDADALRAKLAIARGPIIPTTTHLVIIHYAQVAHESQSVHENDDAARVCTEGCQHVWHHVHEWHLTRESRRYRAQKGTVHSNISAETKSATHTAIPCSPLHSTCCTGST